MIAVCQSLIKDDDDDDDADDDDDVRLDQRSSLTSSLVSTRMGNSLCANTPFCKSVQPGLLWAELRTSW